MVVASLASPSVSKKRATRQDRVLAPGDARQTPVTRRNPDTRVRNPPGLLERPTRAGRAGHRPGPWACGAVETGRVSAGSHAWLDRRDGFLERVTRAEAELGRGALAVDHADEADVVEL